MRRCVWGAGLFGLALGCQVGPSDVYDGMFDAAGIASDAEPTRAADDDPPGRAAEDDDDSDDSGDDGAPLFDVGAPGDEPDNPCRAVDLLFVIDNSGSMGDEQAGLVASFPGFVDGITELLGPATSYHVGVVTTDAYTFDVPQCRSLGALTMQTGGDLSSAETCGPYAAGGAFMTTADDLSTTFACAAQVGIDGAGVERPMQALEDALTDPTGESDACNAGFVRDDALLVVVVITDEEDDGDSIGDPTDWHDTVLDAKHGDEDSIVVLSLIGHDKPNACIPGQWTGMMGAEISPRLIAFTGQFEHGIVGDVCAPDYAPFFAEAVDGIADACNVEG